ncbi:septum formation family protein [Miniimonas sp. S16]|uniref:septum formation family protein n=1 Tax=Miniimonas sp. S16 TaxID=2171623 RepID=UPI000D528958|nr:septum formation family protein [Miniimonas sp. S16]
MTTPYGRDPDAGPPAQPPVQPGAQAGPQQPTTPPTSAWGVPGTGAPAAQSQSQAQGPTPSAQWSGAPQQGYGQQQPTAYTAPQYAAQSPATPPPGAPGAPGGGAPTGPATPPTSRTGNPGAGLGWLGAALGLLVGFVGIVLGAMSISRSRAARASITPGVVAVVVGAVQVIALMVTIGLLIARGLGGSVMGSNPGDTDSAREIEVTELSLGNCIEEMTWDGAPVLQVPCADAHTAEVMSQFEASGNAYPGEDELWDQAQDSCTGMTVPSGVDTTNLFYDAVVPTLDDWDSGHRMVSCLLVSDGATMYGSATAGDLRVQ